MLKLWMPMNKDLRNQGLKLTYPSGGGELADDGRFGKVWHTSSASNIDTVLSASEWDYSNNPVSFGGWIRFDMDEVRAASTYTYTGSSTVFHCNLLGNSSYGGFSLDAESNNIQTDGQFTKLIIIPHLRVGGSILQTAGVTITDEEWHHFFVSFNPTSMEMRFYHNGVLRDARNGGETFVLSAFTRSFGINLKQTWGGNPPSKNLPFYVHDVRVYGKDISDNDIKRLYKDKLLDIRCDAYIDGESINYMASANTEDSLKWSSYGFGSKGKIYLQNDETPMYEGNVLKIMASGGSGTYAAEAARWVTAKSIKSGETVTFSYYAKGAGSTIGKGTQAHIYNNSGGTTVSTGTNDGLTADWKRYSHTMKWTGSSLSSPSYSVYAVGNSFTQGEYFYACNFQFEIGSEATPYHFLNNNYPVQSEFGGRGILVDARNVSKSGGTWYFNGQTSIMEFNTDFDEVFDKDYTISFWVNSTDPANSRGIYFGSNNSGSGLWCLSIERLQSSKVFAVWNVNSPWDSFSSFIVDNDVWIHCAVVRSGTTFTAYKNAVAMGNVTDTKTHTSYNHIHYLGGGHRGGDIMYMGYMDKVKMWSTAFTAEDVLSLYNKEKSKFV